MTLITNAFYFAVKHIGYALAVAVITILPMTMTLVDAKLFPVSSPASPDTRTPADWLMMAPGR